MTRYVAFLRAINVGGHTVAMNELKRIFERLGFDEVETFIASGNVIFRTGSRAAATLERRIERSLTEALGYEVATFLRTDAEVAEIARRQPFPAAAVRRAVAMNIAFLAGPVSPAGRRAVEALTSDIDTFHVQGREIHWMCLTRQSESGFSNAVLERVLQGRSTIRGVNTLARLAARLATPGPRARNASPWLRNR